MEKWLLPLYHESFGLAEVIACCGYAVVTSNIGFAVG
jgi:hypothetical protein